MAARIGGLAASHHPDNTEINESHSAEGSLKQETAAPVPQEQGNASSAASVHSNAPLLSVLRRDGGGVPAPTLQFESASGLLDDLEDSDDDMPRSGEKRSGRRKIKIEYIEDKSRRHITFSKRKAGIMKKAYELSTLTGTQVLLLVASETGHVYTFATPKLQPLITKQEGKNLIQACLNSPDHLSASFPEYISSSSGAASAAHYETDLVEDDLAPRSASTSLAYIPTGTTPTPSNNGNTAASVAAAAAQVFMNSAAHHHSQYPANVAAPYWNGPGPTGPPGAIFNPHAAAAKSSNVQQQQSQQSQQQQQQQMYHALLQQQQQLYQQYQQQQHLNKSANDPNE